MTQAIRKLPLSLTRLAALGRSDTTNARWPIALNTDDNPSTDRFSPAATTNSSAAWAASGRPNTGAATNRCPAAPCASVSRSAKATLIVDDDM